MTQPSLLSLLAVIAAACGTAPGNQDASALSRRDAVTAAVLARDAPVPGLAADLERWGYVAGTEARYRRGSRRLTTVTSRTLRFRTGSGARAYVDMVGAHASAYEGLGATSSRIPAGYLLSAGTCGCATEVPHYLAVVAAGRRVTWLEVGGRTVTPATVDRLLREVP